MLQRHQSRSCALLLKKSFARDRVRTHFAMTYRFITPPPSKLQRGKVGILAGSKLLNREKSTSSTPEDNDKEEQSVDESSASVVEMKNESSDSEEQNKVESLIRDMLAIKSAVNVSDVQKEHTKRYNEKIDYSKLGFEKMSAYLISLPWLTVKSKSDGCTLEIVYSESAESFHKKTSKNISTPIRDGLTDSKTKDEREKVENLLRSLLERKPSISLSVIQEEHMKLYNKQIDYQKLGFKSMKPFLDSVPWLKVEGLQKGQDQVSYSKSGKPSGSDDRPKLLRFNNMGLILVDSLDGLGKFTKDRIWHIGAKDSFKDPIVAMDCEMSSSRALSLIQVCTEHTIYIFDVLTLCSEQIFIDTIGNLLQNGRIIKVFQDLHWDAKLLNTLASVGPMKGALDMQLVLENETGNFMTGLNGVLNHFGIERHKMKGSRFANGGHAFDKRPISLDVLQYASNDVFLLRKAASAFIVEQKGDIESLIRQSSLRAAQAIDFDGARIISFDFAKSFAAVSHELLSNQRPNDIAPFEQTLFETDVSDLVQILPFKISESILKDKESFREISLDLGETPVAWSGVGSEYKRRHLCDIPEPVTLEDLACIVKHLKKFGLDNRAGLEGSLHRISAIRNRDESVIGLTIRVGRYVKGSAFIISDLLHAYPNKSILFLGEPGSGKTTFIREVASALAETKNVVIVDTSNEIAGDCDLKHKCVGKARRMMVPSLRLQKSVMVECVQNHTPDVMVIDEIGRSQEVEAARTCVNRGVRLIASAHGNLEKLVSNQELNGLIGEVRTVIYGDIEAKEKSRMKV